MMFGAKTKQIVAPTATADSEMMRRVRSSVRCSTTVIRPSGMERFRSCTGQDQAVSAGGGGGGPGSTAIGGRASAHETVGVVGSAECVGSGVAVGAATSAGGGVTAA